MYFDVPWLCRYCLPGIWLICGTLVLSTLWMASHEQIISESWLKNLGIFVVAVILTSFVASYFVPKVIRRLRFVSPFIGLMTSIIPIAIGSMSLMYFVAKPDHRQALAFVLIAILVWLTQVYIDAAQRVASKNLIKKNFSEQHEYFVLKRPIKEFNGDVHLSLKQHLVKNWIYFLLTGWSTYELITSDFKALVPIDLFKYWLLSSLGLPLMAYATARLVQGFYLWFYIIWKLERKTGKKFLFPEPTSMQ
jgi:hypothetical protein